MGLPFLMLMFLIGYFPFFLVLGATGVLASAGLGYRGEWFRRFLILLVGVVVETVVFLVTENIASRQPAGASGEWAPLGHFLTAALVTLLAGFPVFLIAARVISSRLASVAPRGRRSNLLLALSAVGPLALVFWVVGPQIQGSIARARRDRAQARREAVPRTGGATAYPTRPRAAASRRATPLPSVPDPVGEPQPPPRRSSPVPTHEVRGQRPSAALPPGLSPAEELEILRRQLRQGSLEDRVVAARHLTNRRDRDSAPEIAALMRRTTSIDDQAMLCQSLANLGALEYGPEVLEWLRALVRQDRACAACFRCALGFGVPESRELLLESAARGEHQNRRQALVAMGGFIFVPVWVRPRVDSLYDADPEIRQAACESLVTAQHQVRDRPLPAALGQPGACGILRGQNWRPSADALRAMAEGPPTIGR